MIIDYKNKLVFIATTKNASTSIESSLKTLPYCGVIAGGNPRLKHIGFDVFQEIKSPLRLESFLTWCVVRHPIDKLVSWYNYRCRDQIKGTKRYLGGLSFSEYVDGLTENDRIACNDALKVIGDDNKQVDMVFDFCELNEVKLFLWSVYGMSDLPLRNSSAGINIKYTPTYEELVLAKQKLSQEIMDYLSIKKIRANDIEWLHLESEHQKIQ